MLQQITSHLLKNSIINATHLNFSRKLYETHYDILNLKSNCSSKEIRDSFIKLSKKYHPDINKNKLSHAEFQKINEAYNILSKPESRKNYDLGLVKPIYNTHTRTSGRSERPYHASSRPDPWRDPIFWSNRNMKYDKFYRNQPYYGVQGIKRVSNGIIVTFCMVLVFIGVGLQFVAISNSVTLKRDDMLRKSIEAQNILMKTQEVALKNGKDLQIELIRKRLTGKFDDSSDK